MPRVKLGDIAIEYNSKHTGPKEGIPTVGLEHLMPGEVTLSTWDIGNENTFSKSFRKGQVLFGRRRAYLKKAAVAPFDGICSGDITVIEAIPSKILPELLPFLIQNDQFFDYSIGKSAGSLSPRVKWEDLVKYEVELPPVEEQKRLAEIFWKANETRVTYRNLLIKNAEIEKVQFDEMFGNYHSGTGKYATQLLSSICQIKSGGTPTRQHPEYFKGTIPWITTVALGKNYIDNNDAMEMITQEAISKSATSLIPAYSIMIGVRVGVGKCSINTVDMCASQDIIGLINIDKERFNLVFLKKVLESYTEHFEGQKRGTTIKGIPASVLAKASIPVPSIELQNKYAVFIEQINTANSTIRQSHERLESCLRILLNNTFLVSEK